MVQFELDPRYMPNSRSPEQIEFHQKRILRIFPPRVKRGNENGSLSISLEQALFTLCRVSYRFLKQVSDDEGCDLDYWVGRSLSKSLPFLQGVEGNFSSFPDFRRAIFERKILFRLAIDRHRLIMRQEGKHQLVDSFPSKEVRKRNLEGFQPPLLNREGINSLVDLLANEEFLVGLTGSAKPLRGDMFNSWEPEYFSRLSLSKQRALNLWLLYPSLTSPLIASILKTDGLGEFPAATIRVWVKRALDRGAVLSLK